MAMSMSDTATPEEPPNKRRRPHLKSRGGCFECRRRRVKCNEERPRCGACVRRVTLCEYATDAPARKAGRPFDISHAPGTFDMSDLALLHHWTVSVSLDICRAPEASDIWQRVFPQIGFEHPFVTHVILSITSLQLAKEDHPNADDHLTRAAAHHNAALQGFQHAVAAITPRNSEALFVWSLLNMIYVFGVLTRPNPDPAPGGPSRKDLVLGVEWIPMFRGIEAVLRPTHETLRFGRMESITSLGNWADLEPGALATEGVDGALCRARETWEERGGGGGGGGGGDGETYDEVLRILRKCRMFMAQFETMDARAMEGWGYNRSWSGPLIFIHFAPQAYFTLLHQRQPQALVLFAFFGALLHSCNEYWFVEGLGGEIVRTVSDMVGPYWRPWISWPLEYVRETGRPSLGCTAISPPT